MLGTDKMNDADLASQSDRYEWVRGALGQALQQPDLSHSDVVAIVADGVRNKVIPSAEASKILGDLPTDPGKLRDALAQRQVIAVHGLVHMTMERNSSAGPVQSEAVLARCAGRQHGADRRRDAPPACPVERARPRPGRSVALHAAKVPD